LEELRISDYGDMIIVELGLFAHEHFNDPLPVMGHD
jgi:hypothetical protein